MPNTLCHHKDTGSGTCTAYFSLPNGSKVFAWDSEDQFLCQSGGFEKVFQGPGFYSCGSPVTSLNYMRQCFDDSDCPSTLNEVTAECKCGWGSVKKCGALPGNQVYRDFISSLKEHFYLTASCRQSWEPLIPADIPSLLVYEPCSDEDGYRDMVCKLIKAQWANLLDAPSCVQEVGNPDMFPEVYLTN